MKYYQYDNTKEAEISTNSSLSTFKTNTSLTRTPDEEYDRGIFCKSYIKPSNEKILEEIKEFFNFLSDGKGKKLYARGFSKERSTPFMLPGGDKENGKSIGVPPELNISTIEELVEKNTNDKPRDIYFTVNNDGQYDAEITTSHCIFVEIDKDANGEPIPLNAQYQLVLEKMGIEPSYALFSGNKSLHIYYIFDSAIAIDEWVKLEKDFLSLIPYADTKIGNKSRVLRLPGFLNHKSKRYSTVYHQTDNKYSFEELRAIIPTNTNKEPSNKPKNTIVKNKPSAQPFPSAITNQEPILRLEDFEGCILGFVEAIFDGKNDTDANPREEYRSITDALTKEVKEGGRDNLLNKIATYLAAAVKENIINQEDAVAIAEGCLENFEGDDFDLDSFKEKFDRALVKSDLNFHWGHTARNNPKRNPLSKKKEIKKILHSNQSKSYYDARNDWESLGQRDKNKLIISLYKGGITPDEADTLTNTPIRQNLLTGQIEVNGNPVNLLNEEIEFQNKHNVRHLNFEQVINNEASKNIYNPVAEKLVKLYFQITREEEESRGGRGAILGEYKNRFVANYQAKTHNINATYSDVFPPLTPTLESLEEFITKVFHINDQWYIESIKHMMISAVARAIDSGCKVDTVTIFKSPQGFNKSEMIRLLAYEEYYVAKRGNSISNKDDLMESARGWIQEYGEIDKITASRCSSETKDNFSRSTDIYRKPYAKVANSYPRHWIDVGTTNEDILFLDVDNRRYNVVELKQKIDKEFLIKYRDSAWAIATQLYFTGEKWWFDENDKGAEIRKEKNLQYMYVDSRSEFVLDLVPNSTKFVSPGCIANLLEHRGIGDAFAIPAKKSMDDATHILKKSGWEKVGTKRINGKQKRGCYLNPQF